MEIDSDTVDQEIFFRCTDLFPQTDPQRNVNQRIANVILPLSTQNLNPSLSLTQNIQPLPTATYRIAVMCGINTSLKEVRSNRDYLNSFFPEGKIDIIPNKSHGVLLDLTEVFFLNYLGISINTATALRNNWSQFHRENRENPQAKILQFCHSQGAIHVRNALLWTPKEIRERVIVVAISPGAIIPKEMCFASFNYASKRDLVPWTELAVTIGRDSTDSDVTKKIIENQKQLILLDPHPEANLIDHSFQSPTFREKIKFHIEDYIDRMGQYPDELLC